MQNFSALSLGMAVLFTAAATASAQAGYEIFEYACNEGNYAMRNRLSAARAQDAKDAAGRK
jgi:hypothetical protein